MYLKVCNMAKRSIYIITDNRNNTVTVRTTNPSLALHKAIECTTLYYPIKVSKLIIDVE